MNTFNKYYKLYKNFLKNFNKDFYFNYKPLCFGNLKRFGGGRNNTGKITIRNRGNGIKRLYKNICFNYLYLNNFKLKTWVVERIEKDSNRTGFVALLSTHYGLNVNNIFFELFNNNFKKFFNIFYVYILAGQNLKKGDLICFFNKNRQYFPYINQFCKLKDVKTGSNIFNITLNSSFIGNIGRSAGVKCKLLRKYRKNGLILLSSGKKKLISLDNYVTLGYVSNEKHHLLKKYKAGNSRWKGRRPCVRGVAKNPIDHPHGGGEGKSSGGRKSVSPWGKLTKGFVTVKKKRIKKKKNV